MIVPTIMGIVFWVTLIFFIIYIIVASIVRPYIVAGTPPPAGLVTTQTVFGWATIVLFVILIGMIVHAMIHDRWNRRIINANINKLARIMDPEGKTFYHTTMPHETRHLVVIEEQNRPDFSKRC